MPGEREQGGGAGAGAGAGDADSGAPWWVRFVKDWGLATLLVLYLLDFIPGVQSPLDRLEAASTERQVAILAKLEEERRQIADDHREVVSTVAVMQARQLEVLRLARLMCRNSAAAKGKDWAECLETLMPASAAPPW